LLFENISPSLARYQDIFEKDQDRIWCQKRKLPGIIVSTGRPAPATMPFYLPLLPVVTSKIMAAASTTDHV
jgi:hypothetical protein